MNMNNATTKRCPKCGIEKPISKYYAPPKYCKSCDNERRRKFYIEHKEEVKEHNRKFYIEHKEEVKEHNRKFYIEHKEEIKENSRKYYADHPEKVKERVHKYRTEHKEEINEYSRKYYAEHQEERKEYSRKHSKEHPEERRVQKYNRRAYIKGNGGTMTAQDWNDILKRDGHKCLKCGNTENLTLDHIIPLAHGGRNDKNNAQVLCGPCNSSKSVKTVDYRPLELFKQESMFTT